MESSDLPRSVSGTRPPERLAPLPYAPEDNARKRFELERERRRAEKSRKDAKDPGAPRDTWDGEGKDAPRDGPEAPDAPAAPERPAVPAPARGEEGGLDVVA